MNFINILFLLSAVLTLGCTILILVTKNIIHSCIYLLGTLIGVAGLYVTLGADFVAAVQILVYVGGIVVLMLFAVMLTGGQEFLKLSRFGRYHIPPMGNKKSFLVGSLTALVFGLSSFFIIIRIAEKESITQDFSLANTVEKIGTLLITDHVLAFEMVSVLLLGALVGAAIISRPSRGKSESQ